MALYYETLAWIADHPITGGHSYLLSHSDRPERGAFEGWQALAAQCTAPTTQTNQPARTSGAAAAMPAAVAGGGSFGVEAVRNLASVADVNRLLHEASARERAIDSELEQLLFKRCDLERQLLQLHVSTEEVRGCGAGRGWLRLGGVGAETGGRWPSPPAAFMAPVCFLRIPYIGLVYSPFSILLTLPPTHLSTQPADAASDAC